MSDSAVPLEECRDFAPIDGVHELRQRQTSRLWYRALQIGPVVLSPIARSAPTVYEDELEQPEAAALIAD